MIKAIDTHCHLNLEPLYSGKAGFFSARKTKSLTNKNWRNHLDAASQAGVVSVINIGTDYSSSYRALKMAKEDHRLKAVIGIHPEMIEETMFPADKKYPLLKKPELSQQDVVNSDTLPTNLSQEMAKIIRLSTKPEVVAIGETGLDYYYLSRLTTNQKKTVVSLQKKLFIKHIKLANQVKKPLVIHTRDKGTQVYEDVLQLLSAHYLFCQPFILHCVSGTSTYVKEAVKLGAYISAAGNVTYPNADKIKGLVKLIPSDRLLAETDAPFLAPQAHRGKINRPTMVIDTIKFLQTEMGVDPKQIFINSKTCFSISD